MISFIFVITLFPGSAMNEKPNSQLINAISQVESEDGSNTVGGELSGHGRLQIRKECLDDVNDRYGTNFKLADTRNYKISVLVFHRYMEMYATKERIGRTPTDRDMARIWNGGPDGWRHKKTLGYWHRVRKHMSPA